MIIDELIKEFRDKNIVVDKKRKDILEQDYKEPYVSRQERKRNNYVMNNLKLLRRK